jgi:hypothetical protein
VEEEIKRSVQMLQQMKQTLIQMGKEHGVERVSPMIADIDRELGIEPETGPISDEDEMQRKIKEMQAELALTDEEFETRLLNRLKDEIRQNQS